MKSIYFLRNSGGLRLFNIRGLKFLFAATGYFRLNWRSIISVHKFDD